MGLLYEGIKNRTPYIFDSVLESIQAKSVHTDIKVPFISLFHFGASAFESQTVFQRKPVSDITSFS